MTTLVQYGLNMSREYPQAIYRGPYMGPVWNGNRGSWVNYGACEGLHTSRKVHTNQINDMTFRVGHVTRQLGTSRGARSHALVNWNRRPPFLFSDGCSTRSQICPLIPLSLLTLLYVQDHNILSFECVPIRC